MENKNLSIEECMLKDSRVERKNQFSVMGAAATLVGAVLTAGCATTMVPEGMVSMLCCAVGLCLLVYGLVKLFSKHYIYVDKDSKQELRKCELSFDNAELGTITNLYNQKNFVGMATLKKGQHTGVVLHVYGNEQSKLFYSMLMKYVPYQYQPVQDMTKHTDEEEVKSIAELIRLYSANA